MTGIGPGQPASLPPGATWYAAPHPLPDERSVAAARAVLEIASAARPEDVFVLLLSGGASSMMALPAEGVSLDDKRRTVRLLLEAGADIGEVNTVRKHLSAIKGGRLAAASKAPVVTFAISDVVGDDLSVVASGPTVADASTFEDACGVLDRRGGPTRYPNAVIRHLERGIRGEVPDTPKPGDPRIRQSRARVIGTRLDAMRGARAAAESLGYHVHVIDDAVVGEARAAGHAVAERTRAVVDAARTLLGRDIAPPVCVIASGETTVHVTGSGKGGRNQECTLGMLRTLDTLGSRVIAASIGTDGIDGPTDAAGAIVDSTTLARAEAGDVGPAERYLNDNNTYEFFDKLGDLIRIGPTTTNVGDLQVILVGS
jgi:hydroxypyruvate reductase